MQSTELTDELPETPNETLLLSEAVLGRDWNRPEEDAAWSYLQPTAAPLKGDTK